MRQKKILNSNMEEFNENFSKKYVIEFMELLGNKKKFYIRNFLSGVVKGVGGGIGFTIITAIVILFLRKIVTFNLPVIGSFIADIVDIVSTKL